jgi:hypothetical protein
MHGLSPRTPSLTVQQTLTNRKISEALAEFPSVITELISQMAIPDFYFATQPLEINDKGGVIKNQRNQKILASIELALTASSSECMPSIKSIVFIHATEQMESSGILKPYLVEIIGSIVSHGLQINLDGVCLDHLKLNFLADFRLDGLSAKGASFNHVKLDFLKMAGADFSGAKFVDCSLQWTCLDNATITDASFSNVSFGSTGASELRGNQSGIVQCTDIIEQPGKIVERDAVVSMTFLEGEKVTAQPDRDNFTLPATRVVEK